MKIRSVAWTSLFAALLSACQTASPPSYRVVIAPDPARISPSRSGAECDSVIARATAEPAPAGLHLPRPDTLYVPPLPVPRPVHGRTAILDFWIDQAGRPVADSLRITGVGDAGYTVRLRETARWFRFLPAVLDGCAVPSRFQMQMQL